LVLCDVGGWGEVGGGGGGGGWEEIRSKQMK